MTFAEVSIDPLVQWPTRICLTALFAWSALDKLRSFALFEDSLDRYRLLPRRLSRVGAVGVLAAESFAALGMLFVDLRRWAALAMVFLMLLYAAAIAINLIRGRVDLDCGCHLGRGARVISRWMVWRNVGLAILASSLLLKTDARTMGAMEWLFAVGAALAVSTLYQAANLLLGDLALRVRQLGGAA